MKEICGGKFYILFRDDRAGFQLEATEGMNEQAACRDSSGSAACGALLYPHIYRISDCSRTSAVNVNGRKA